MSKADVTIFLNSSMKKITKYEPLILRNLKIIASQNLNEHNYNKIGQSFEKIGDLTY